MCHVSTAKRPVVNCCCLGLGTVFLGIVCFLFSVLFNCEKPMLARKVSVCTVALTFPHKLRYFYGMVTLKDTQRVQWRFNISPSMEKTLWHLVTWRGGHVLFSCYSFVANVSSQFIHESVLSQGCFPLCAESNCVLTAQFVFLFPHVLSSNN